MGCCCSTPQEEQQSLLSKDEDLRSPSSPSSDWRTERERNIQERSQQFQQRHEAARTVSSAMSDEEEVFSEGEGEGEGEEGGGGGGGEIEAHPSVLLQSQVPEREETEEEREKAREEARKLREEAIIQRENASLVDLQTEMLRAGGISKLEETGIHDFIVTTFKKPTYCRYCCGLFPLPKLAFPLQSPYLLDQDLSLASTTKGIVVLIVASPHMIPAEGLFLSSQASSPTFFLTPL